MNLMTSSMRGRANQVIKWGQTDRYGGKQIVKIVNSRQIPAPRRELTSNPRQPLSAHAAGTRSLSSALQPALRLRCGEGRPLPGVDLADRIARFDLMLDSVAATRSD